MSISEGAEAAPLTGSVVPEGWKAMDDFAAGIDTNRIPATDRLTGMRWRLRHSDGTDTALEFQSGSVVRWSRTGADGSSRSGTDSYEAIEAADGVFYLDQTYAGDPYRSEVTIVSLTTRRTATVTSVIAEVAPEGRPRVSQEFLAGTADLGDGVAPNGPVPHPTRDLIGWRALYRYSPHHLYEHVYLSSERYCWQCVVGEQRGHGDVDLATTWKVDEKLYVFTFREFLIPVAATWLYDLNEMRSTGKFFGIASDGTVHNSPGGAYISSQPRAEYPEGAEPA